MTTTIKQLRQQGYKVRVMHSRILTMNNMGGLEKVSARGGSTKIEVTTPDKSITVVGLSVCSMEDNFSRKIGNSIALGRAIEKLKCNK